MEKKIAFVLPTTLGNSGGIKMVFSYANEINKLGNVCDVIYPLIPSNYKYYKLKKISTIVKYTGTIILNLMNYNYRNFKARYSNVNIVRVNTLNELKELNYDSYIATAWDTYYYVKQTKSNKKYLVQSYETWAGPSKLVEETYNDHEFEYYTISKNLQNIIYKKHNIKSTYLPNPLDNILHSNDTKNYTLNRYGIIYRREKNKNFGLIKKFLEENIEYKEKFYCLGRNIPKRYKKLFAKCYDGNEKLQVENFYKDINMFIMPSNHEGFSLPIMEAISFNNIIISTTTGVIVDFHNEIKYINIGEKERENKVKIQYNDLVKALNYAECMTREEKEKYILNNRKFYIKYISDINWNKNIMKIIDKLD